MVGDCLDHAFSFSDHFEPLETQVISSVAWRLDGRVEFDPCAILHVGIFDRGDAAEAKRGNIHRGGLVFQIKQVGSITGRAGRQGIGVERLHVPNGALQRHLPKVETTGFVKDLSHGDGVSGHGKGRQRSPAEQETDEDRNQFHVPAEPSGCHRRCHSTILAIVVRTRCDDFCERDNLFHSGGTVGIIRGGFQEELQ